MARRGKRKSSKSKGDSVGSILRKMPAGFIQILLATGIMAVGAAVASALSGNLTLSFTVGSSTVNLDLGFIPGMAVVFGGLYMFLSGLRKVTRTKI